MAYILILQIVFLMEQVGGSRWKGGQRELLGFTYLIICFPLDRLCLYCLFWPGIPPESMRTRGDIQMACPSAPAD